MKKECTAFQYLQQLDNQAAIGNKRALRTQEATSPNWLGLTFFSYTRLYATKINFIEAVIPVGKIYSFPYYVPNILGISHYHNKLFMVIDLKNILWQKKSEIGPKSRIIIYRYYDFWFGLLVCSCEGLKRFKADNKMGFEAHDSSEQSRFIKKMIHHEKQSWALLNVPQIISGLNNQDLFLSSTLDKCHGNKK